MSDRVPIIWRAQSPHLQEARLRLPDGREVYAGYVARTLPLAETASPDVWRGYVGQAFTSVGMGALEVMRWMVEDRARAALARTGDQTGRAS